MQERASGNGFPREADRLRAAELRAECLLETGPQMFRCISKSLSFRKLTASGTCDLSMGERKSLGGCGGWQSQISSCASCLEMLIGLTKRSNRLHPHACSSA